MAGRIRFLDFELDEARFELRHAGRPVAVQPKVLRLLLHLVSQRDRVVSTDELFSVLWPRERVGMASIRRAVIGLRRALGERGDGQNSVRTVRGFGYQFIQPVYLLPQAQMVHGPRPRVYDERPTLLSTWARQSDDALVEFGMAETLPLYGPIADQLRDETLRALRTSR